MKYYKNTELANLFHVSEKAVRNWVDATQQGKLNLELHEESGRFFIANTTKNMQLVEEIVAERQKFKNTRGYKVISPKPEFYNLFTSKDIADIISSIDLYSELPIQYSYFDGGATEWKKYVARLLSEANPNTLKSTIELLELNQGYFDLITAGKRINLIDLGVGDATPVKGIIQHLIDQQRLNRYIGVDLSEDMLKIARTNIKTWFGEGVPIETHVRDLSNERFNDLITEHLYIADEEEIMNVVLLLGGTLSNLRLPEHALRVINSSIGRNDILIYSLKIDSESSRRYFDFRTGATDHALGAQLRLLPNLLNLDESYYDVEQYYDDQQRSRFTRIRLKYDINLKVMLNNKERSLLLNKGKTILLWRARHKSVTEVIKQFDDNDFDLLHAATAPDKSYLLTISTIKTGQLG